MSYPLLALDLDGTLTNGQKVITPRTLAALQAAQERGTRLVLASGRPTRGIAPLAEQLDLARYGGYVLSYNGGKIIEWDSQRVVHEQTLTLDLVRRLYAYAQREDLPLVTYSTTGIITDHVGNEFLDEEARINQMPVEHVPNFLEAVEALPFLPTKCLIAGPPDRLAALTEEMRQAFEGEMEVFRSAPFFIELPPLGIDKALSLQRLLEHLGLNAAQLMACGDGYNDLSMLRLAGCSVAMANAEEEVKAAAHHITTSNEEDGVGVAVERFILQG